MQPYTPKYKPNQILLGSGKPVIVSGWTTQKTVSQRLDPEYYAAIGQLYSATRGISFLLRNLLVNPQCRQLIILNGTRMDQTSGAVIALRDFFQNGFEKFHSDETGECWKIRSSVFGSIDINLPQECLEDIRNSVQIFYVETIAGCVDAAMEIKWKDPLPPYADPREFPLIESMPEILPGSRYGHLVEAKTIAEAWVKLIHRIKTTGTIRPTGYDGNWQELIDLMVVVTDEPEDFFFPEPNYLPLDRAFLEEYIPQMVEDAPYKGGVKYTYGQRMRSWFGQDQIYDVIQKLLLEIDSASCVINLWDSGSGTKDWLMRNVELKAGSICEDAIARFGRDLGDSDHNHGGSPCLNHIWVRVVDGELSLTATFRSNDMFSAWPSNAMGLMALQKHIIKEFNDYSEAVQLKRGPLITISQSAHIYDDCWDDADRMIAKQYQQIMRQKDYVDPVGNFIVEVEGDRIVITQTFPKTGEVCRLYNGKVPQKLIDEIYVACPAINPGHLGYLGMEIQKARACIEAGRGYIQDR
jgi:thymidylate synthase